MSLHCLVKLEMIITHVLPLSCYRKKLEIYCHLNCGPKFARFEFSVQNTHHSCARTETATENGVGQAGFLLQLNGSTCATSISSFTRWCKDIIQVRWKTFINFAAHLLRKLCTNFCQNRPSFIGDITESILLFLFWTQCTCSIDNVDFSRFLKRWF